MPVNPLMANDAFKRHKRFHLLEKYNSLRKRSKSVKITKYVEQTLGKKNSDFFGAPPALKRTHEGGARGGVPPRGRVRRGTAPRPHHSACMASVWA